VAAPFVGIDVGTNAFHAVAIDESHSSIAGRVFAADELDEDVELSAPARVNAIDAPDRPSTGAHLGDERVAEKFREGRCGEVALGLVARYWVPWVTPAKPVPGSWIDVGIALHERLRDESSADVIETFPYACFRRLGADDPLPTKSSVEGMRSRVALLEGEGFEDPHLDLWSHDSIDAAVAALVAAQYGSGVAEGCGCPPGSPCGGGDGSVIWLPASPARAAPS
jgi:predicted nuclease with RNAse H fold